jgi:16S rRNA (guanine(966)-N(2))-methyltransferase RsmD
MRVITGTARGRKLQAVPGMSTRPTSAKIKEAVFNIVQFELEGKTVLDLFAGTGQMGIEALSRGAGEAVFVDIDPKAVRTLRENLKIAGIEENFLAVGGEALTFLTQSARRFDIVFLDPPYGSGLLERALEKIAEVDICSKGAIIICEHGAEERLPELAPPYRRERAYTYGGKALTLYRREG